MAVFTVPGMKSLLLNDPWVQLEGCCFLSGCKCLCCIFSNILWFSALELSRTTDFFATCLACLATSHSMKISSQVKTFQVSFYAVLPSPVYKVYGIISNKILFSTSGRKPREISITYIVWGVSQTPVDNNLKRGVPCVNSLLFLGVSIITPRSVTSFKFMYNLQYIFIIYIHSIFIFMYI